MHAAPLQITQIRIISLAPSPPPCEWHIYARYINDVLPVLWLHHLAGKSYPSSPEKCVCITLTNFDTNIINIRYNLPLHYQPRRKNREHILLNMPLQQCTRLYYTGYMRNFTIVEKNMDHPWARSDGVKVGGTCVKVLGTNKIVGIVPKKVGPVQKQVGSVSKLYEFVFFG